MTGIIIFLVYGVILYFLCLRVKRKNAEKTVKNLLFSEGNLSSSVLIPGIFNSWLWATSIIGAAEACLVYGFYGGISFAVGTGIGVCAAVFFIIKFKRHMEGNIFITDFVRARFCESTELLFYVAVVLIVIYMIIEQAVGLGSVFSALFGMSFKNIAFFSIFIALVFVIYGGMRGVILNDILSFAVIFVSMFFLLYAIYGNFDALGFIGNLYNRQKAVYGSKSTIYCLCYGVSAMIRGFAQILLDPAYYLKAHLAKDRKTFVRSFIAGGVVLWVPFVAISSLLFGYITTGFGEEYHASLNMGHIVSNILVFRNSAPVVKTAFGVFLLLIAFTSIMNSIIGIWSIGALKIYPKYANPNADETQCLKYGALFTALMVLVCSLVAVSLEQMSLFTIDVFSGIFFSTPAGILVSGMFGRKKYGSGAVYALVLGLITGFVTWIYFRNSDIGYFYATAASFASPVLFLFCASHIKNEDDFNFASLRFKK